MSLSIADLIGWAATAVFAASYFFRRTVMLRGTQMFGAALWTAYGVLIDSKPVVVANILVFAAAAWSLARECAQPAPKVGAERPESRAQGELGA